MCIVVLLFFFLIIRRPPRSTRTYTLFPYTTLFRSERPLMIVGGSGWSEDVRGQVQAWAEASEIPVGAVFRRQDYLDNDWPGYVGDVGIGINPKLQQRVKEADLLLVMGSSAERRVGKEGVSTCSSRWSAYHEKKKQINNKVTALL